MGFMNGNRWTKDPEIEPSMPSVMSLLDLVQSRAWVPQLEDHCLPTPAPTSRSHSNVPDSIKLLTVLLGSTAVLFSELLVLFYSSE